MSKPKALKRLSDKKLDALVEAVYYATCSGVEIDIMDIGKVFKAGRTAYAVAFESAMVAGAVQVDADATIGAAVKTAVVGFVQTIRKN